MKTVIDKVNEAFKSGKGKWNFIIDEPTNVQIKLYIGVKECDLQVFKIRGLHHGIGFNYGNKTNTKKAIIETLQKYAK